MSRIARDTGLVVWVFGVLGLIAGLVWAFFAPYSHYTRFSEAIGQGQLELSETWNADAWFVVLSVVAGLAGGLFFGFRRRMDPLAVVIGVLAGSAVGVVLMAGIGTFAGPSDPTSQLMSAAVGTSAGAPLDWPPLGVTLAFPLAAVVGVLVGLFAVRDPEPQDLPRL